MNRRKLLGMLGLLPATAVAADIDLAPAEPKMTAQEMFQRLDAANLQVAGHIGGSRSDRFSYRGYRVFWTGWKQDQAHLEYVAQRLVRHVRHIHDHSQAVHFGDGQFPKIV